MKYMEAITRREVHNCRNCPIYSGIAPTEHKKEKHHRLHRFLTVASHVGVGSHGLGEAKGRQTHRTGEKADVLPLRHIGGQESRPFLPDLHEHPLILKTPSHTISVWISLELIP